MSGLPSENTANNEMPKPAKQKRERKQVVHRRGRSMTVSVVLTGDVRRWAQEQADANFRAIEGQIAYCVKQEMDRGK